MKYLAVVATVLLAAGCAAQDEHAGNDTGTTDTSPALAPAPANTDSAAIRDSIMRDSARLKEGDTVGARKTPT
jgi:hypothetical protein